MMKSRSGINDLQGALKVFETKMNNLIVGYNKMIFNQNRAVFCNWIKINNIDLNHWFL